MSQSNASFGIAITGSDKTAAAAKSAERRLSQIPKKAGAANRRFAEDGDRTLRRHSRSIIRTFRETEQAGARLFGGRSITSGIASRLGGIGQAASAAGTGLGEAAASGGVLSSALGIVGTAAGATIGILASAAYAAISVANNWAKGAASIGRTAAIIGVGTRAMQEFTAAAERQGVDKGAATGALGSLSQTLNDAKYGRNTGALSVLGRLGVGMQTHADGTVNVEAMLPAIADALKRQNSSGRRTAARALGISLDALPAFTEGGAVLSADMADASKHANVLTSEQIDTGTRIARKGTIVGQMKDRVLGRAGALAAGTMEGGYDAVIQGGQALLEGASSFEDSVDRTFRPSVDRLAREVGRMGRMEGGSSGQGRGRTVRSTAATVSAIRRAASVTGVDPNMLMSIAAHESGLRPGIKAPTSSATGLFQFINSTWFGMMEARGGRHGYGWAASAIKSGQAGTARRPTALGRRILDLRKDAYLNAVMGGELAKMNETALRPVLGRSPSIGESYMANFLGHAGARKFYRAERRNPNASAADLFPAEAGANRSIFYGRDGSKRSLQEVERMMTRFVEQPIQVKVDVHGAGSGATATVTAGRRGRAPAVSHAMAD